MNLFVIHLAIGAGLYCLDQFLKYAIQKRDAAEDFKKVRAVLDEAPSEWKSWLLFVVIAGQLTVYSLLWPRYATRSLISAIKHRKDDDDDDSDDDDDNDVGHGAEDDDDDEAEYAGEPCTAQAHFQVVRRAHGLSHRVVCNPRVAGNTGLIRYQCLCARLTARWRKAPVQGRHSGSGAEALKVSLLRR